MFIFFFLLFVLLAWCRNKDYITHRLFICKKFESNRLGNVVIVRPPILNAIKPQLPCVIPYLPTIQHCSMCSSQKQISLSFKIFIWSQSCHLHHRNQKSLRRWQVTRRCLQRETTDEVLMTATTWSMTPRKLTLTCLDVESASGISVDDRFERTSASLQTFPFRPTWYHIEVSISQTIRQLQTRTFAVIITSDDDNNTAYRRWRVTHQLARPLLSILLCQIIH